MKLFNNSITKELATPTHLIFIVGVALIFFNIQVYVMQNFASYQNNMCVDGGNFTLLNITYSVVMSILMAVFIVTFISFSLKKNFSGSALSLSSLGSLLGTMTVACSYCTLVPLIGFASAFSLFIYYQNWIKVIALLMIFSGLFLLNQQIQDKCSLCKN